MNISKLYPFTDYFWRIFFVWVYMARERRAQVYSGGLGAQPPVESRGKAPAPLVRELGRKAPTPSPKLVAS